MVSEGGHRDEYSILQPLESKCFREDRMDQGSNPAERLYKQGLRNKCFILQQEDEEQFGWILGSKFSGSLFKGERE